jgi:DsbC/DsbD-like thiol-disulfide interchange protein
MGLKARSKRVRAIWRRVLCRLSRGDELRRLVQGRRRTLLGFLVSIAAFATAATAVTGPHGSVDLISERAAIAPGRVFRVGLHFQLEKGWHIYWLNPGDSGEPPKVQWNLPEGFRAGRLMWPTPRRIPDHTLIDYGYRNEVLLPVEIHASASLAMGHDARLDVNVRWLVCREMCIPGRAALTLSLPVRKDAHGAPLLHERLFSKASTELPKPAPKQWKLAGTLDRREFNLVIETGRREGGAMFFPLESNQIENAAPQNATPVAHGILLRLRRSDQLLKPITSLAGILVLDSARSYIIKVPVRASR